ncbi:unnamed protein product [Prorocentrum cordatum]|uniref:Uncharacterized protein n=1 Tax=Prorocentrum cordatum TaxID=2364126 RepID=A0ABN9TBC6_9DINO|nr:unnamed protein product [Polarella glacialis]
MRAGARPAEEGASDRQVPELQTALPRRRGAALRAGHRHALRAGRGRGGAGRRLRVLWGPRGGVLGGRHDGRGGRRIRGSVHVLLRPLVDALNPCGGVTIYCTDRPTLDLKIRAGSELLPNLYDLVRDTVDDVIASIVVVPNCVAVSIPTPGSQDAGDWVSLRYPLPTGIVRVTVEQLVGSPEAPVASPYVQMHVGAATWRTPVGEHAGHAASWAAGNVQDFAIYTDSQCVELRAFSGGALSLDGLLGRARVPVARLLGHGVEVPLELPGGGGSGRTLVVRGDQEGSTR